MLKKILIVTRSQSEKIQIEQILESFLEEGGELFFASSKEDGLKVINKEKTPLIFVDDTLVGDRASWQKQDADVIILTKENRSQLKKLFLTNCQKHWGEATSAQVHIPPM